MRFEERWAGRVCRQDGFAWLFMFAILSAGMLLGCNREPKPAERVDRVAEAIELLDRGEIDAASESISKALVESPENTAALLVACKVESAKGDRSSALQIAESIPPDAAECVEATALIVQWRLEDQDWEAAADRLQWSIERLKPPSALAVRWTQQLWDLLSRLGRRQEASVYADQLCRAGRYNRDVLVSLLRRGEAYPMAMQSAPEDRFAPGHGMARWWFSQEQFEKAAKEMDRDQSGASGAPAAHAFRGRLLVENQQFEAFPDWFSECPKESERFADYWVALGVWFFEQQSLEASARALAEAVYLDPTDDDACHRLARVLAAVDRDSDALFVREHAIRVALLRELSIDIASGDSTPDAIASLPEQLLSLGRPFESIGWAFDSLKPGEDMKRRLLTQQHASLRQNPMTVNMASEIALTEIDRSVFAMDSALKELAEVASRTQAKDPTKAGLFPTPEPVTVDLRNVASELQINFQWFHADPMNLASLPLHEMMGGGIGVLDFDLDGRPDLYLAQGSAEPPTGVATRSNQLLRNQSRMFLDVTAAASVDDRNYSSGIAVGDVNQDGFPDLFLGALGKNRLLLNNGDGTFQDVTEKLENVSPQFTSSVAIADLTGDGIPELFECVYVEMSDGFRLPEKDSSGRELAPSPNDFYAESDRWWLGNADGSFESRTVDRTQIEPGTGLGVVITDLDGSGRNQVFVSNDARPNHLLSGFEGDSLVNRADLVGLGVGFRGISNSCMGIASADFNRDGELDFHITNFINEPANHFIQGQQAIFGDASIRYQLHGLTTPYTGFGVVAADLGWDGWPDLLVANGHVFDSTDRGRAFRMPTQALLNLQDRFVEARAPASSSYMQGKYVGRAIATLDWDGDLDLDFVIGHLDEPVALLDNQTTKSGNGIQLRLVGTATERTAVGTRIRVRSSTGQSTHWVLAGDGYLCSHQKLVDVGVGNADQIDEVEIEWASGARQVYRNLKANERYLLVEGQPDLWLDSIEPKLTDR